MASVVDVFRKVCLGRHSTKRFATGRSIPKETLADVLKSTMAAPSGFNLQPWQIIMVQDSSIKEMLAEASMLGAGNQFRVNDASAIAVFCADLQLRHRIERVVQLEVESNRKRRLRDDGYLASLPLVANILTGEGFVATGLKRAATDILSYSGISSMPDIEGVEAWSYKNVCFAAQNYMLSATSHNLATCAMEGFDSRRVRDVLRIPDRYGIPLMVATGYPYEEGKPEEGDAKSPRLDFTDIVFDDQFGNISHIDEKIDHSSPMSNSSVKK